MGTPTHELRRLGLSQIAEIALSNASQFDTVEALLLASASELLRLPGFGMASWHSVEKALKRWKEEQAEPSKLEQSSGNRALPPNAGKGRPKGIPNKATKALKDMILGALDDVGGQSYLAGQAAENPGAFLTLIGKVLPSEIKAEHAGPDGGPMGLSVSVTFIGAPKANG